MDKRPNTKSRQIKREKPNLGSSKIRLEEILKGHLGDQEGGLVHECARRHFFHPIGFNGGKATPVQNQTTALGPGTTAPRESCARFYLPSPGIRHWQDLSKRLPQSGQNAIDHIQQYHSCTRQWFLPTLELRKSQEQGVIAFQ